MSRARPLPRRGHEGAARPVGRQLGQGMRKRLVLVVSGLLRQGEPPTLFAREGLMIAAVRSAIVLRGEWTWRDADRASRDVVLEALRAVGAKRPTWAEASTPDYAQNDGFTLVERTRCRNCGMRIPPENWVFCSPNCGAAFHQRRYFAEAAANAAMLAEGLL